MDLVLPRSAPVADHFRGADPSKGCAKWRVIQSADTPDGGKAGNPTARPRSAAGPGVVCRCHPHPTDRSRDEFGARRGSILRLNSFGVGSILPGVAECRDDVEEDGCREDDGAGEVEQAAG